MRTLTQEEREVLKCIRQCEALMHLSHQRRDEHIVRAVALGIPQRLIAESFGATGGRVWQVSRNPFKIGQKTTGKGRKDQGKDGQKSS